MTSSPVPTPDDPDMALNGRFGVSVQFLVECRNCVWYVRVGDPVLLHEAMRSHLRQNHSDSQG